MTSRGKNILIGSLITGGALIVLVIAAAIGFGVWLNRPGELLDPTRLLSSGASGYAEWTLRLDDPGTEGFVELLIEADSGNTPQTSGVHCRRSCSRGLRVRGTTRLGETSKGCCRWWLPGP